MGALERAIAAHGTGAYDDATIEFLFPEVKEKGDLWYINELEGFLASYGCDYFGTGEWQKFEDWLEKQKEYAKQEHPQVADASKMEQPVEGLEEEVKKYWNAHALDYRIGRVADLDFLFLCALHFAEWGAIHLNARNSIIQGYEQAEKETINRACKWLFSHLPILLDYYNEDIHEKADRGEFIKLFRTQMEEEQ